MNDRIIQKIMTRVEAHLGDVVEDPENAEDVRESAWTLAVDAAQDLSLDDPTSWAQKAMAAMGYGEKPEGGEERVAVWPPRPAYEARRRKMPCMIQPIPVLGAKKQRVRRMKESVDRLVSALLEDPS